MKNFLLSLKLYVISLIVIVGYNAVIYAIGHIAWSERASGSLIIDNEGQVRGSYLLAQDFSNKYFRPRSLGQVTKQCDTALYNLELDKTILEKYTKGTKLNDISMIVSSSSLLDPYITAIEARDQIEAIAVSRKLTYGEIDNLVAKYTIKSSWLFFSLDIVNTTKLNYALECLLPRNTPNI